MENTLTVAVSNLRICFTVQFFGTGSSKNNHFFQFTVIKFLLNSCILLCVVSEVMGSAPKSLTVLLSLSVLDLRTTDVVFNSRNAHLIIRMCYIHFTSRNIIAYGPKSDKNQ